MRLFRYGVLEMVVLSGSVNVADHVELTNIILSQ